MGNRHLVQRIAFLLAVIPLLFFLHKPFYWFEALHFDALHIDREIMGVYVHDLFPFYNYPDHVQYSSEYYVFNLCRALIHLCYASLSLNIFSLLAYSGVRIRWQNKICLSLISLKGFMLFNLFMFVMSDNQWNWYLQVYVLIPFLMLPHAFYHAFNKKSNTRP